MIKVLYLEVKVKIRFVRDNKKWTDAWNIYLMDLIEKKSRKSISRMQK